MEGLLKELPSLVGALVQETIKKSEDDQFAYNKGIEDLEKCAMLINLEIEKLKFLKEHICEYNEEDYCIHCGNDGRS